MSSNDKHVISKLFNYYLRMYAVGDFALLEYFSFEKAAVTATCFYLLVGVVTIGHKIIAAQS